MKPGSRGFRTWNKVKMLPFNRTINQSTEQKTHLRSAEKKLPKFKCAKLAPKVLYQVWVCILMSMQQLSFSLFIAFAKTFTALFPYCHSEVSNFYLKVFKYQVCIHPFTLAVKLEVGGTGHELPQKSTFEKKMTATKSLNFISLRNYVQMHTHMHTYI